MAVARMAADIQLAVEAGVMALAVEALFFMTLRYLASDELMKKQQGRKALIILSDGVDRGSKLNLESAIESAQKADTVVYVILFADKEHEHERGGFGGRGGLWWWHGTPRGQGYSQESRPDGKKILERISKQTGGRLFEVSKKHPIDKIYESILCRPMKLSLLGAQILADNGCNYSQSNNGDWPVVLLQRGP